MTPRRSAVRLLLLCILFAAGCAYGMLAERARIFPYRHVRAVLAAVRGGPPDDAAGLPSTGRWAPIRAGGAGRTTANELTDEQQAEIERLESIGYLTGSVTAGEYSGVTVHDPERAWAGLNLVVSGHEPWAGLMEMNGRIVHEWQRDFATVWPGRTVQSDATGHRYWRRAHLLPNGDLLAIHEGLGLVRLDRDSDILWKRIGGFHHDLDLDDEGNIWVLDRDAALVPRVSQRDPILEDFVTVLQGDGDIVRRFSLLEAFEGSPYHFLLKDMGRKGDIFHTNTLEILDGRLEHLSPAFRAGNLLISILMLDTIAVVDPDTESVVWALKGMWSQQHQPTVLNSGRMLLFDNKAERDVSKVIEFDPFTQVVSWTYRGTPERPFFTETCGSNQRLPNGNTLLTESDNGRALEVAHDGTTVWEYVNPHRAGPNDEYVATLFEVVRLSSEDMSGWMDTRN